MTDEHDDIPRSVRDFRLMARTGFWVVVGICAVIGALVGHVIHEERQDTRIQNVEKWQAGKDEEAREAAKRERWRAFRKDQQQPLPLPFPGIERPKEPQT